MGTSSEGVKTIMTKNEFISKIDNGYDIMFDVLDRHFTIVTWLDEGIGIGEQHKNSSPEIFGTAEELVECFKVDGRTLADLAEAIKITQYS